MRNYLPLVLMLGLVCFAACSNAGNPISSELSDSPVIEQQVSESDLLQPNRGVFGAWRVDIDTDSMTASLTPARNSVTREAYAIGDIYDSNLSQFVTVSPCANCLGITNLYFDGYDNLCIEFKMRHPFANLSARPDLHGFDVRLILFFTSYMSTYDDLKTIQPNGNEESASLVVSTLLNEDGYTAHHSELTSDSRYFTNPAAAGGTVNPFLRFFEDYATSAFDPAAPAGHNVMPVGSDNYTRTAVFNGDVVASQGISFYAVADVSYGVSAKLSNRLSPQYYLPEFNRTEPWRVEYWIENNNLDWQTPASTADIVVQVFDWQHNATVDPAYPNASNLSGISQSSKVKRLELSIPAMMDALITTETPESGTGSPTDPLKYRLTVTNIKTSSYKATGLLQVKDELHGQPAPAGRLPIPQSPSGFPYSTLDIRDYSIYKAIYVNIADGLPNTSFNHEMELPLYSRFLYTSQKLEPEFFMDPGHKAFQYRWDFNYDGYTFDIDGSGLPSPDVTYLPDKAKQRVALRVRTNSVPPREYLYDFDVIRPKDHFKTLHDPYNQMHYSTSGRRGHAVAMSSEYYYVAYIYESGGQRDIHLAVGNDNGSFQDIAVTNNADVCMDPTITVIEDGVHDGVYIAYEDFNSATDRKIYSTYGNLDGTGFSPSNIVAISNPQAQYEHEPTLIHDTQRLLLYYTRSTNGTDFQIYIAYSDDYGLTWNDAGPVDNTSLVQFNPTAAWYPNLGVVCVWDDWRNLFTEGVDLYSASGDGVSMYGSKRVSVTEGLIHEFAASVTMNDWQTVIAYLSNYHGSPDMSVYVRIDPHYSGGGYTISPVSEGSSGIMTMPSVTIADGIKDRFVVAYGSHNDVTNQMTAVVLQMITYDGVSGLFTEYAHHNESAGSIVPGGAQIFPGVVSRPALNGFAVEYFAAWRDFTGGAQQSIISPDIFFENIRMHNFYSYGIPII